MIQHKKNTIYYLSFPAIDSTTPASYKTGLSPVDTAYYKDGVGAWTSLAITDAASEIGSTGVYEIDFSATEMNHDKVFIKFAVSGMADDGYMFDMSTNDIDDLSTAANLSTTDGKVDTAQADLNTITGSDGVTLATAQALYAPNVVVPDAAGVAPTAVEIRQEMDSNSTVMATIATDTTTDIPALISTAQTDLDTITGTDGVTLATAQALYAPNVVVPDAAGVAPTATENADALLNRDMSAVSDTTARSPLNALRFLRNKWSVTGTTLTVTKEDDSTAGWTATVTTDAAADPITGNDPA